MAKVPAACTRLLAQRLHASGKREHRLLRRSLVARALPGPPRSVPSLAACLLAVACSARNASTGRLPPTMQTQADRTREQDGVRAAVPGFGPDLPGQRARTPRRGNQVSWLSAVSPMPRFVDTASARPRIAGAAVRSEDHTS